MVTEFWCNRCLEYRPYTNGGSYSNSYKSLTFCQDCMNYLIKKDPQLGEGYINYLPQESNGECDDEYECACQCHFYRKE